ncbi:MAG: ABC transporter permease [Pseudomonadota bacterium]|nr:ABC transporter permease [Pseudomonadota bacterium]
MSTPKSRARQQLTILLGPVTLFLGIFFAGPLGIMLVFSLLEPGLYGGVEWNFYHWNYGRLLGWADGLIEEFDAIYLQVFGRSFRLALITVALSLIICYPAAYWVSRSPDKWKGFCIFLITLPFFASLIVRLYAWLLILRPTGFLNHVLTSLGLVAEPLDLLFSRTAVLIGMVYIFVPFMFLPIYASIEKLDMSLVEASKDLGASTFQTFRRIIVPLTLPGIVGGSIIVFIPSLGNFIVPDLLGGAKVVMIGNLIEQQFLYARNWPFGAALSMLLMAAVLVFLLVYITSISRQQASETIRG